MTDSKRHNRFVQFIRDVCIPDRRDINLRCKEVRPTSSLNLSDDTLAVDEKNIKNFDEEGFTIDEYELDNTDTTPRKEYLIDLLLKLIVKWSGTIAMFCFIVLVFIAWIVAGIVLKAPDAWQIVMQDGQSIQCYFWDTLLMRQQLDDHHKFLTLYAKLKSRVCTHKRLLGKVSKDNVHVSIDATDPKVELSAENWFDTLASHLNQLLGSPLCILVYWAGVFAWVGCGALKLPSGNTPPFTGKYDGSNPEYAPWSSEWQMYINTAVAVVLLITSVVLENVRIRNDRFVREEFQRVGLLDCQIEGTCRYLTGDTEPNDMILVKPCKRKSFEKGISVYAHIVGTGIGLVIAAVVFAVWIAVGSPMGWSSNWWLIIGTYTGLIGYIDGFVLREVYQTITSYEDVKFQELLQNTQELLDVLEIDYHIDAPPEKKTFQQHVSVIVNEACSSKWAVLGAIFTIIGLICASSAMHWNVTGQLMCNTPTMIIEAFCLMILIQAHVWADYRRRFIIRQLATGRILIRKYLEQLL